MQVIVHFKAIEDDYGEFNFTKVPFPNHYSPSEYKESNSGNFYRQFSVDEGQNTYVIYALGRLSEQQKLKLQEDWDRHCH
ncbi:MULTISPECIES: hypothetical protein [unclassified Acinetobacter]|uniref:hypothetical protein n=1 Tax=unclassified Acinetobacter TaxID=196816 RepID=UPI0015D3D0C8|nr:MULTISPECIES: hypothetical protein [unclassified Acinetobacter]